MTRAPEMIVVGDEAYTPEEWEAWQRRRAALRLRHQQRYRDDPEYRERQRGYARRWREANKEHRRAYERAWMKANRLRSMTDDDLAAKIRHHREFMERYVAELSRRRRAE